MQEMIHSSIAKIVVENHYILLPLFSLDENSRSVNATDATRLCHSGNHSCIYVLRLNLLIRSQIRTTSLNIYNDFGNDL